MGAFKPEHEAVAVGKSRMIKRKTQSHPRSHVKINLTDTSPSQDGTEDAQLSRETQRLLDVSTVADSCNRLGSEIAHYKNISAEYRLRPVLVQLALVKLVIDSLIQSINNGGPPRI
jgi:hypothetical protein